MIYPSADVLENWGSKYSLVVLAAKRAKQLKSGAPPLIQTSSRNPLTIALEEIAAGKVLCQVADHDILPKSSQEAEVAQLLAIPTLSADDEEADVDQETSAVLVDDSDLYADEEEEEHEDEEDEQPLGIVEEEEEHEVGYVADLDEEEEAEAEEEEHDEDEEDAEVVSDDIDAPGIIPAEEPKPKARRGRKPKAETVIPVDEELAAPESEEEPEEL